MVEKKKTFTGKINKPLIAQYVRVYLANQRKGTASTKTRAEVSGGGRKPWRQKGTGRARHGSIRSPIWVGGGVAHGPRPRDWSLKMPKKMRRTALLSALALAESEGRFHNLRGPSIDAISSKKMAEYLESKKLGGRVLIVLPDFKSKANKSTYLSARNIEKVDLVRVPDLNAYIVGRVKNVVFVGGALKVFQGPSTVKDKKSANLKSQKANGKTTS
jgi:large subunit ribosomal protein L4